VRWVSARGRLIDRDAEGRAWLSAGVFIDVDVQRSAELGRQRSEARFRRLVENVPLPLCQINARQEMVFVNASFVELFGPLQGQQPTLESWWTQACPDEVYRAQLRHSWQQATAQADPAGSPIRLGEFRLHGKAAWIGWWTLRASRLTMSRC